MKVFLFKGFFLALFNLVLSGNNNCSIFNIHVDLNAHMMGFWMCNVQLKTKLSL